MTKNFSRERLISPNKFVKKSFRTIKEKSGHDIIVGKLKGSKNWKAQAILHPKNE